MIKLSVCSNGVVKKKKTFNLPLIMIIIIRIQFSLFKCPLPAKQFVFNFGTQEFLNVMIGYP